MAEKIVIEVYKTKNPEELTKLIADPKGKLETGSGVALSAAVAAAFLCRAAAMASEQTQGERMDYILRNAEKIRAYMVHLIDEDTKCRGPLKRAMAEGGEREIEAARHPAVSICEEIVCMMGSCQELLEELADICPEEGLHYIRESAELAMAAAKSAVSYIVDMTSKSCDDTYRFVARRENEITMEQQREVYEKTLAKLAK